MPALAAYHAREIRETSKTLEVTISSDSAMCTVPIPFDPKEVFGNVRAPVKVTINGFTFRSTIARMGGKTFIPLRAENREAAAVRGGDKVLVNIVADREARTIDAPADLVSALKGNSNLWRQWRQLSYTVQRESVELVLGAKRPETRERRIKKVVELVAQKVRVEVSKQDASKL